MTELCVPSVGKTLCHELFHLVAAGLLATVAWFSSGQITIAAITFATCFFLDLDHVVDYGAYLIKFRQSFSVRQFLSGSYFSQWQKFVTPLHSWELVVMLIVIGSSMQTALPFYIAAALAVHYLIDYLTNPVNIWAYWFIYRASHRWYKPAIARGFIG